MPKGQHRAAHAHDSTHPQLDIIFAQKHGMAAHHDHRPLGRHPGPCAAFAKHHGDRLTRQHALHAPQLREVAALDEFLGGIGGPDERRKFGGGQVGNAEQMARSGSCAGRGVGADVSSARLPHRSEGIGSVYPRHDGQKMLNWTLQRSVELVNVEM